MIPIKNVYYMLSYAWENTLKREGDAFLDTEEFENIHDFLASVLIQGIKTLIKSGFYRNYVDHSEPLSVVRGRINLNKTLKEQTHIKRQLVCDKDYFTEDILFNQIVKSTLKALISNPKLDTYYRIQCKILLRNFARIKTLDIRNVNWNRLIFTRTNQNYRLIINICELIHNGLISDEKSGEYKFSTFFKDDAMAKLYEKFILNFYKKTLPGIKVSSPIINWLLTDKSDASFLPIMKTDIVLESEDHVLIIDTKYTPNILIKSNHSEVAKHSSIHMYQIYSYIKNMKFDGKISGLLLYPTVDFDIENTVTTIEGNDIHFYTVDLKLPFEQIKNRLLNIASLL